MRRAVRSHVGSEPTALLPYCLWRCECDRMYDGHVQCNHDFDSLHEAEEPTTQEHVDAMTTEDVDIMLCQQWTSMLRRQRTIRRARYPPSAIFQLLRRWTCALMNTKNLVATRSVANKKKDKLILKAMAMMMLMVAGSSPQSCRVYGEIFRRRGHWLNHVVMCRPCNYCGERIACNLERHEWSCQERQPLTSCGNHHRVSVASTSTPLDISDLKCEPYARDYDADEGSVVRCCDGELWRHKDIYALPQPARCAQRVNVGS